MRSKGVRREFLPWRLVGAQQPLLNVKEGGDFMKILAWYCAIMSTFSWVALLILDQSGEAQWVSETAAEASSSNFWGLLLGLPIVVFLWIVVFKKKY